MSLQCTLFFNSRIVPRGFSETYISTGNDYTATAAQVDVLLDLRLALMADDVQCVYVRISDPTIKGDSIIGTSNLPKEGTYDTVAGSDMLSVACMVRQQSGPSYHTYRFLRNS